MGNSNISRRSFMKTSTLGAGAAGLLNPLQSQGSETPGINLPREVYLAAFASDGLRTETASQMADLVEKELQTLLPLHPDIICLPETFTFWWGVQQQMKVSEQAAISKEIIKKFTAFAQKNNLWIICPVITSDAGKFYNSAVVIDRRGSVAGEYHKMHPTDEEMLSGISPGQPDPPVFETDFGKIGIQICFDIQWNDGWEKLSKKGAEIIFWPSAFTGGFLLNARAWQHKAVIVSAPLRGEAKICDMSGEEVSKSGYWQKHWVCGRVNPEKAFIHVWPYVRRFDEMQKKYGRNINIKYLHNEEIAVIESLSPEIDVKDILKEFEIRTHAEHIEMADQMQKKALESGIESLK